MKKKFTEMLRAYIVQNKEYYMKKVSFPDDNCTRLLIEYRNKKLGILYSIDYKDPLGIKDTFVELQSFIEQYGFVK